MTARTNNPDTTASIVRNVTCQCGEMWLCPTCGECMACETAMQQSCDGEPHCVADWHDCWFCCREARLEALGR
jgi:hypothetical protein